MENLVPIKKVFSIIDSCTNTDQLAGCKKLASAYTKLVTSKGVVNPELVQETLEIKIQEKQEELEMVENFCAR
jgi:phage tail sheath gpL-like